MALGDGCALRECGSAQRCEHRWTALSPLVCPLCESPWLKYMEVTLERRPYLINGHADGAVHDLDGFDRSHRSEVHRHRHHPFRSTTHAPAVPRRQRDAGRDVVQDQPPLPLPHEAGPVVSVAGLAEVHTDRLHLRVEVPSEAEGVRDLLQSEAHRSSAGDGEGREPGGQGGDRTRATSVGHRHAGEDLSQLHLPEDMLESPDPTKKPRRTDRQGQSQALPTPSDERPLFPRPEYDLPELPGT